MRRDSIWSILRPLELFLCSFLWLECIYRLFCVERFFDRSDPDKQFLLSVIDSCDDPAAVMENYRKGLALINSKAHYDEYASSGFFTVVREDNSADTREQVCHMIAKHFGLT